MDVRDNLGVHIETSLVPSGKWSNADLSQISVDPYYFYRLAYAPPKAQEGSCHSVKVVVNRPDSFVFARNQYCNVKNAPEDPLLGTAFGKRLETFAGSPEEGKLNAWLQTGFFYANEDRVRIEVALDFSWNSLKRKWSQGSLNAMVGVVGLVSRQKDSALIARFSDFGCCSRDTPHFVATSGGHADAFPQEEVLMIPTRYEVQTYLPSGDDDLRMVLSDDVNFDTGSNPWCADYNSENGAPAPTAQLGALSAPAGTIVGNGIKNFDPKGGPDGPGKENTIAGDYLSQSYKDYLNYVYDLFAGVSIGWGGPDTRMCWAGPNCGYNWLTAPDPKMGPSFASLGPPGPWAAAIVGARQSDGKAITTYMKNHPGVTQVPESLLLQAETCALPLSNFP